MPMCYVSWLKTQEMTTATVHYYFTSNKSLPAAVVVTVTVIIFNGVPKLHNNVHEREREKNTRRNKLSQQEQKGHVLYKKNPESATKWL